MGINKGNARRRGSPAQAAGPADKGNRPGKAATKHGKSPGSVRLTNRGWLLVVFLLSFLLYANTIPNRYVLDDFGVLNDNWVVKKGVQSVPLILKTPYRYGSGDLTDQLYRPLSLIMFAAEWQIAPDTPAVSHFMNVLLFALSSCLLLLFLSGLFGEKWPLLPVLATLLWAAHPVHTEVVANIKSRDEILSVLFAFAALIFFTDHLRKGRIFTLVAAATAYFLGLMSKEGIIPLLAIFPLTGWLFTRAGTKKTLVASAVMVIPVALYLVIRGNVLDPHGAGRTVPVLDNLLMAAPDLSSRMATAILLLGKYLFLTILPWQLVSDYSYNQIPVTGWGNPLVLLSLLTYVGALAFALVFLKKKSIPAYAVLFFLVTMSIYSNLFVIIGTSFGERFLYLPSVGFAILIAWGVLKLFRLSGANTESAGIPSSFVKRPALWSVIGIIMVLYGFKTVVRNSEWYDQLTLFSYDIKRSPESAHLRYYWGLALRDEAKLQEDPQKYREIMQQASEEFRKSVTIFPNYSEAYHQLGLASFRLGDKTKALEYYTRAMELNPTDAILCVNMGGIYFDERNFDKCKALFLKAVSLNPNYGDAWQNLGSVYGMTGRFDSAVACFSKATEFNPDSALPWYYLGVTYRNMNQPEKAGPYLEKAYQLDPGLKK